MRNSCPVIGAFILTVALTHAANLRATSLLNYGDETGIAPDQHRRRMEEISQYWTPERIHAAQPRDVHIPKPEADTRRQLQVLQWMDDEEEVDEYYEDDEDEDLDRYDEYYDEEEEGDYYDEEVDDYYDDEEEEQYEGQVVPLHVGRVVPFATNCQVITNKRKCRKSGCGWSNRKCFEKSATTTPPPPLADAVDVCAGKAKRKCKRAPGCTFLDGKCLSSSSGNTGSTTTTTVPPPAAASTCTSISLKRKCRKNTTCVWDGSCKAAGGDESTATTTVAAPSNTCALAKNPCKRSPVCSWTGKTCVDKEVPPTTITKPTTSTTTTTTTTTTTAPPSVTVQYILPSASLAADPVDFEWVVTVVSGSISMVKLVIEYPGGSMAYLDRSPTADGHDSVTTEVDAEGQFRWSVWTTANGEVVDKGPWQSFQVEGGPQRADRACYTSLARYTERDQDLHKAVGRIMFRFGENNYLCSGTLVEGADDRAIIATAAHCVFDQTDQKFPDYVMFIPGQGKSSFRIGGLYSHISSHCFSFLLFVSPLLR